MKFGSSCSHSPCDAFRTLTNGSCRFANSPETWPQHDKEIETAKSNLLGVSKYISQFLPLPPMMMMMMMNYI